MRKKSFNCKEDFKNINESDAMCSNMKEYLKKNTKRFSDISFINQQEKTLTQLLNNKKIEKSLTGLQNNQPQLYNITERNNEEFNKNERNQNDYVENKRASSKIILASPCQQNGKASITISDESIIYIDSLDTIDCKNAHASDTSSFMTTSCSSSSSSCSTDNNHFKITTNNPKSSLKIRVDDNTNHDYHAIDDNNDSPPVSRLRQKKFVNCMLEPPRIPPPPLPASNILSLTNSIDSLEHLAKLKRQQKQKISESNNCYEKSWESSTNFLIDKLLNKYNVNNNNNNSTSSFSNSSVSGQNSSANSNRNSKIMSNEQALLLQTQKLLKQNLLNSLKSVQTIIPQHQQVSTSSLLSLSPTNTISSTNSLSSTSFNKTTNNNEKLSPPQMPPPPLPLDALEQLNKRIRSTGYV